MKNLRLLAATALAAALACGGAAQAAVVTSQLGDIDAADGTQMTGAALIAANANDPAPFNIQNGGDTAFNFSASWTHTFAAVSGINAGSITIGLFDGDAVASGDQVANFSLDGVDLTAALNAAFEASAGLSGYVYHYTVALTAAALAMLADGSATIELALTGPGMGTTGVPTLYNGGILDFSLLSFSYDTGGGGGAVPEPGTASLLLLAGLGAFVTRRRSARRHG